MPVPALDMPPPSPANPQMGGMGGLLGGGQPPASPMGSPQPDASPGKGIMELGFTIDKALTGLLQGMPDPPPEFAEARRLLQIGFGKLGLAAKGAPTETGAQFPGAPPAGVP